MLPCARSDTIQARYRPAEGKVAMGGDWHDVVDLAPGRLACDCVGRGLAALRGNATEHGPVICGERTSLHARLPLLWHGPHRRPVHGHTALRAHARAGTPIATEARGLCHDAGRTSSHARPDRPRSRSQPRLPRAGQEKCAAPRLTPLSVIHAHRGTHRQDVAVARQRTRGPAPRRRPRWWPSYRRQAVWWPAPAVDAEASALASGRRG